MYICCNCGGKNLQEVIWVNVNTREYKEIDDHPLWCEDCSDTVDSEWIED